MIYLSSEASTNYSQDKFGSAKTKLNATVRGQPNTYRALKWLIIRL